MTNYGSILGLKLVSPLLPFMRSIEEGVFAQIFISMKAEINAIIVNNLELT